MSEKVHSDHPDALEDARKEEVRSATETAGVKAQVEQGGAMSSAGEASTTSPGETVGILPAQHWAEQVRGCLLEISNPTE